MVAAPPSFDWPAGERVLWRAERLTEAEATAIIDAYPPRNDRSPALHEAWQHAFGLLQTNAAQIRPRWAEPGEVSDRIAWAIIATYNLPGLAIETLPFSPQQAQLYNAIDAAWMSAVVGHALTEPERVELTAAFHQAPAEMAADRFGPRTAQVEAFLAAVPKLSPQDLGVLGLGWKEAKERVADVRMGGGHLAWWPRANPGHLAAEAAARCVWGGKPRPDELGRDDRRRLGTYVVGRAARAVALRGYADRRVVADLEWPWQVAFGLTPEAWAAEPPRTRPAVIHELGFMD